MIDMKTGCTAILCSLTLNAASATQWQRVTRVGGAEVFIDEKSKRYDRGTPLDKEGDRRKVHVMFSYDVSQRDINGNLFYSEIFVDEVSCSKRTVTTLSTKRYALHKGQGALVYSHKVGTRLPQAIEPGTVNEFILETFICEVG